MAKKAIMANLRPVPQQNCLNHCYLVVPREVVFHILKKKGRKGHHFGAMTPYFCHLAKKGLFCAFWAAAPEGTGGDEVL